MNKCPQHCIAKELNITVCINLFSLKSEQLEQKQLPLCEGCCLIALHIIIYPRHHRGKDNKAKGSPLNSVSTKHLNVRYSLPSAAHQHCDSNTFSVHQNIKVLCLKKYLLIQSTREGGKSNSAIKLPSVLFLGYSCYLSS